MPQQCARCDRVVPGKCSASRLRRDANKLSVLQGKDFQLSYLKDICNRVRYSSTLPSSIFTSIFTTSAIRRSRNVPAAVATAFFAASSQDCALVPITSVTLYTESVDLSCLAIMFLSINLF